MIKTPIVDEGIYMYEPNDNSGRWVIRHPYGSYSLNESKMFDVYIESPNEPNLEPVIDLGSFKSLKKAKLFIEQLHNSGETYFKLKEKNVHKGN